MNPSYILVFVSIILSAIAQVLMKLGANKLNTIATVSIIEKLFRYFSNPYIFIGFSLYAVSAVIWVLAISKIPLSIAYPMVGFSYVIVVFLSYFILNEQISMLRIIGLALIVAGVITISKS